jgi:hypothetical protein
VDWTIRFDQPKDIVILKNEEEEDEKRPKDKRPRIINDEKRPSIEEKRPEERPSIERPRKRTIFTLRPGASGVAGVDPATVNVVMGFLYANNFVFLKVDMEQQYNPAKNVFQKVKYLQKNLETMVSNMINETWDDYWSYIKVCGIEVQMEGGASRHVEENGVISKKEYRNFVLVSHIIKIMLQERGIDVYFIQPQAVRAENGTSVHGETDRKKSYQMRKEKGIALFRELLGTEERFEKVKSKFGDKLDDVADGFFITKYTKDNVAMLSKKTPFEFINRKKKGPHIIKHHLQFST